MLTGSSQLTRGTLGGSDIRAGLCRFIPACAGNSSKSMPGAPSNTVHPRLRGELAPNFKFLLRSTGSSPLTRGTRLVFTGSIFPIPVHPRLRGELSVSSFRSPSSPGSSPLTRGTHFDAVEKKVFDRFIPAYAGNSETLKMGAAALSVHPRLRGELSIALARVVPICRFIPAYAGNSNRTAKERELQVGSSPLTRGTHGVIPNSRAIAAVHPRLRGELNIRTADAMAPTGSSPLTRGTHHLDTAA